MAKLLILFVVGIIWLIVSSFGNPGSNNQNEYKALHDRNRVNKRKEKLKKFIHLCLPRDLDDIFIKISNIENSLLLAKKHLKISEVSSIDKEVLYTSSIKQKDEIESKTLLLVSDLNIILSANKVKFIDLCHQILESTCEYPVLYKDKFFLEPLTIENPTLDYNAIPAFFNIKNSIMGRWHRDEIEKLFFDDIGKINIYNNKIRQIPEKIQKIKDTISNLKDEENQLTEKVKKLNSARKSAYITVANWYISECQKNKLSIKEILENYDAGNKPGVENYFDLAIAQLDFSNSIPAIWSLQFSEADSILIVEIKLPNVIHDEPRKYVQQKNGIVIKPLNKIERENFIPKIHPAILLKLAYEIFRNDYKRKINLLVLNGWIEYHDSRTGVLTMAYTASLAVKYEDIINLILEKLDPIAAFNKLQGISAGKVLEIVPIRPILKLETKDSRFVEAIPVIDAMAAQANLAAMDWQLFEHLIRELFEKKFSNEDVEVKVTRASRDKGVDAVVFDPDPITGGKYIIQAKRYTNTVDVSSVRDLCAVVQKEGASRGILVTTSSFGADSYEFVKNSPITLINGQELLGLLSQYGYKFRIDIDEAKKLLAITEK